jgi:hydrogenase assembly chaperone hypC/hupF
MISTDLMMGEELAVGDWVLIHVGFALGKIDEAEATETLKQIKQLGDGTFEDELESFTSSQIE